MELYYSIFMISIRHKIKIVRKILSGDLFREYHKAWQKPELHTYLAVQRPR